MALVDMDRLIEHKHFMGSPIIDAVNEFFRDVQGDARRVFHGRGQLYPGYGHVCLDWYRPTLLITAYAPIDNIEALVASIIAVDSGSQIDSILLQKRFEKEIPTETLLGDVPSKLIVSENGLKFEIHLGAQQNTGLFLDMAPLRDWILHNSKSRKVLNLFAYTCSFSVAAMAGEATSVTNVDMSKTSMGWGMQNHKINDQDSRCVHQVPYNIFTSWGRIKQLGRYDLIIIDPPARQRHSFNAEKNYGAVIKRLHQLCNEDAEIVASLNSPFLDQQFLLDKFAQHAPAAVFQETMPAAPEFKDKYPERALKIARFKYQTVS